MRATRFSVRGTIKKTVLGLLVLGEATFGVPLLAQVTAPKHTIDSRVVLVVGHKNPDTDAILSALGLASLLRLQGRAAQSIAQGKPNPETAWVLQRCGLVAPPVQTVVNGHPVMLVDHSDAELAPEGLSPENLIGIVDHHKLGGLTSHAPLLVRVEPVGSTATVLVDMFQAAQQPIEAPLACGLLAAVLSDTRSFTSPTTTAADREAATLLARSAGIKNPLAMGQAMLEVYAKAMARLDDHALLNTDFKRFRFGQLNVGIAQVESSDIGFVLQRRQSLLEAMEQQRQRNQLHTLVLLATDVPRQGSELFVASAEPQRVAALFGVTLQQHSAWVPGLMSRKRQVVPVLEQGLR